MEIPEIMLDDSWKNFLKLLRIDCESLVEFLEDFFKIFTLLLKTWLKKKLKFIQQNFLKAFLNFAYLPPRCFVRISMIFPITNSQEVFSHSRKLKRLYWHCPTFQPETFIILLVFVFLLCFITSATVSFGTSSSIPSHIYFGEL